MALSLVGQVCHKVFPSENKRETERKFIREHHIECCFLFSASLFSLSSSELLFHLFLCSFFSLSQFPSLSTSLARIPLSSPSRLCLLPSQISSSLAWNMNILELRSLKGTMKCPPKLNYTPFPESQKRDFSERWAHRCHVGVSFTSSHTHKLVVSCFFVIFVIFPQISLLELLIQAAVLEPVNMVSSAITTYTCHLE